MRIMAIDIGDVRTGVAFSDPMGMIVGEAFTLKETDVKKVIKVICDLCREKGVGQIVIGNPKHMNATEGERSELSKRFAERLGKAIDIPIILWDERLTTNEAHRILSEMNRRGKERKDRVDAVAASLILEGYLNNMSRH